MTQKAMVFYAQRDIKNMFKIFYTNFVFSSTLTNLDYKSHAQIPYGSVYMQGKPTVYHLVSLQRTY